MVLDSVDIGKLPTEIVHDIVVGVTFKTDAVSTLLGRHEPPGPEHGTLRILYGAVLAPEGDEILVFRVVVRMELTHVVLGDDVVAARIGAVRHQEGDEQPGPANRSTRV